MTANEYVNTLFQYISDLFKRPPFDECKNGTFPPNYVDVVKVLFKKLFRVYAHVYHHHLNVHALVRMNLRNSLLLELKLIWIHLSSILCCLKDSFIWLVRKRNYLCGNWFVDSSRRRKRKRLPIQTRRVDPFDAWIVIRWIVVSSSWLCLFCIQ